MTALGTCPRLVIGNTTSSRDCVSSVIWPPCSSRATTCAKNAGCFRWWSVQGPPPNVCHAKRSITRGLTNKWSSSNCLVSAINWGCPSTVRCWQALSEEETIGRYAGKLRATSRCSLSLRDRLDLSPRPSTLCSRHGGTCNLRFK